MMEPQAGGVAAVGESIHMRHHSFAQHVTPAFRDREPRLAYRGRDEAGSESERGKTKLPA